jgi:alkylation response protein AidB-like acyl-CoA dehydrogenase
MDFELSPSQEAARAAAQALGGAEASPPPWRETWGLLVDRGLVELVAPDAGGSLTGIESCEVLRGLGLGALHVPLLGAVALAPVLMRDSAAPTREHWLPRLRSGQVLVSPAVGEVGAAAPEETGNRAVASGGGWRVSGQLVAVPFADEVDRLVLWASAGPGTGVFLVDPHAEGVTLSPTVSTTGEGEYAVSLDGVVVEGVDVVVGPGVTGLRAARRLYQHLLVGLAAEQLGLAEAALELTSRYVSTREQFGQPIGAFQAVSARAADAFIDLTAMRWTMYRAAEALYTAEEAAEGAAEDTPVDPAAEVAVAKFWAAEGGARVLATAVHLHGGLGVDTTYPLHRYFLRAKRLEVLLGGAGTQLARIWDALTRQEAVVE